MDIITQKREGRPGLTAQLDEWDASQHNRAARSVMSDPRLIDHFDIPTLSGRDKIYAQGAFLYELQHTIGSYRPRHNIPDTIIDSHFDKYDFTLRPVTDIDRFKAGMRLFNLYSDDSAIANLTEELFFCKALKAAHAPDTYGKDSLLSIARSCCRNDGSFDLKEILPLRKDMIMITRDGQLLSDSGLMNDNATHRAFTLLDFGKVYIKPVRGECAKGVLCIEKDNGTITLKTPDNDLFSVLNDFFNNSLVSSHPLPQNDLFMPINSEKREFGGEISLATLQNETVTLVQHFALLFASIEYISVHLLKNFLI